MDRLKPLLPTLKEKKRYLAFEIISKSKIKAFSEISKEMWTSALSYAGTKGVARMGMWILAEKYDADQQKGIVKVSHQSLDELRASLALIERIENQPVIIRSLGASGVLAKAEKKYIGG